MMRLPPGRAEDGHPGIGLQEGRAHAGEHAFAWGYGVGLAADQAVDVGRAGAGGEVVHLVVEQDPGPWRDEAGAEGGVDAQGGRDPVAFAVEDGEVGGVGPLGGRIAARATGGPVGVDVPRQARSVEGVGEARDRDLHEVGVPQVVRRGRGRRGA